MHGQRNIKKSVTIARNKNCTHTRTVDSDAPTPIQDKITA